MTEEEFIECFGRENVLTEEDQQAIEQRVMNGESAYFCGPTKESYTHALHPDNIPVTREMIDEAMRLHGLL